GVDGLPAFRALVTEALLNVAEMYAAIHAQAKKKDLFPRLRMRDRRVAHSLPRASVEGPSSAGVHEFVQTFGHRQPYRLELSRSAAQHGMRIHAEAEIRLARPVLQVVPRFLARTHEIRNFILHDSRRAQPFAGA